MLAPPQPPQPVTDVYLSKFVSLPNQTIELSVSWTPPNVTNGQLTGYQARIVGQNYILQIPHVVSDSYIYRLFNSSQSPNQPYINRTFTFNSTISKHLYLQVELTNAVFLLLLLICFPDQNIK